ncbi:MAG: carbon storage regulator [Planctomycetia bacterium]|nr:carbon storage regulator [Planctomycetia bacterium]
MVAEYCGDGNGGGSGNDGGGSSGGSEGGLEMLVFSRKTGEKISIGDGIEVSVVRISPSTVRIGVVAPKDCTIVRGELVGRHGSTDRSTSTNRPGDSSTKDSSVTSTTSTATTDPVG